MFDCEGQGEKVQEVSECTFCKIRSQLTALLTNGHMRC